MKVLLRHDIPKLGKAGTVKTVADGYGRNYLIPQGLAVLATPGALKQADVLARAEQKRQAVLTAEASAVATQLAGLALTFKVRAGEGGKLYGSITSQHIVDEVKRVTDIDVDKRKIELREPIRSLGSHQVVVRLASELAPELTVNVVREELTGLDAKPAAEAAAEPAAEAEPADETAAEAADAAE